MSTTTLAAAQERTTAGPDAAAILARLKARKAARGPVHEQMDQIRRIYDSDIVVPLPALDEGAQPAIANMLSIGLDQMGMRVGEVLPDIWYPPLQQDQKRSRDKASDRRYANLAWWQISNMEIKLRRRARQMAGYGQTVNVIRPDFKREVPVWHVRDPLTSYPAPGLDPDDPCVPDIIFTITRSYQWLCENYPTQAKRINTGVTNPNGTNTCSPDLLFTVVEYHDADCTVLIVQGRTDGVNRYAGDASQWLAYEELARVPNRTELCLATVGGRINLDRPHGMFDGMVGMYLAQAELAAMENIAVKRAIFPDAYLVSRPGETARFLNGPFEGRSGKVNIIAGGDIKYEHGDPSQLAMMATDRLERGQRVSGAIPPEFGGESGSQIRTGKRGDAIMSATVDHHIAEAQAILKSTLQEENRRAVAVAKSYFGNRKHSFFVTLGKVAPGHRTYTANETFEIDDHLVNYPAQGADANAIVVAGGQRLGQGTMSHETFMEMDPQVADVEREKNRIVHEQLEQALMSSLQQRVASGQLPPADLTRIMELYRKEGDLAVAVKKADDEASQRQVTPVAPGDPAAAPGLADPGMGAEAPTAPVGPPAEGIQNVSDLVSALHRGTRPVVPAQRGG